MAKKNEFRKSTNSVRIVGKLMENNLTIDEKMKRGDHTEKAIKGDLIVDMGEGKEVKVQFFTYALKSDGKKNKQYEGLVTSLREHKSAATVGLEEADIVEITGAFADNTYVSKTGEIKEGSKIAGSFVKRVSPADLESGKAEMGGVFDIEFVVSKVKEDKDNEDKLNITGLAPTFFGLCPITLVAEDYVDADGDEIELVDALSDLEKGQTINLWGELDAIVVGGKSKKGSLGKASKASKSFSIIFNKVTGGELEAYEDGDKDFDEDLFKAAKVERATKLEGLQSKDSKKSTKTASTTTKGIKKKATKPVEVEEDDDDLPF